MAAAIFSVNLNKCPHFSGIKCLNSFPHPLSVQNMWLSYHPPPQKGTTCRCLTSQIEEEDFAARLREEHRYVRQKLNSLHCSIQELMRTTRNRPLFPAGAGTYENSSYMLDVLNHLAIEMNNIDIETEQNRFLLDVYRQMNKPGSNCCVNESYLGTVVDLVSDYEQNCRLKENLENLLNKVHRKIIKLEKKQKQEILMLPSYMSELAVEWCGRGIPSKSDLDRPCPSTSTSNNCSTAEVDPITPEIATNESSRNGNMTHDPTISVIDTTCNDTSKGTGLQNSNPNIAKIYKLSPRSKGKRASSLSRIRSPVLLSMLKKDPVPSSLVYERVPLTEITNK